MVFAVISKYTLLCVVVLTSGTEVSVTCSFYLLNKEGEKEQIFKTSSPQKIACMSNKDVGAPECISKVDLGPWRFCPNDCLTIFCSVTLFKVPHITSGVKNLDSQVDTLSIEDLCDVVLHVDSKDLNAHKAILADRSLVFEAMFKTEMVEKTQNRIVIVDCSYDTVAEMLRFIYTGNVRELSSAEKAEELLKVADKYQLEGLHCLCENALASKVNIETAAELLILGDFHHAQYLKQKAIDFINGNREEVKKTEGWKAATEKHSKLFLDSFF